ncbi:inactive beta-amylase 9-like [Wolffia australiana]
MDVSAVGRQAGVGGSERMILQVQNGHPQIARRTRSSAALPISRLKCRIALGSTCRRVAIGVRAAVRPEEAKKVGGRGEALRRSTVDRPQLFVGLPADAVSDCNTVNHSKAIAAGLKALKLLGVDGVELPVWWGIVEKEAMGKYDWSGYLSLVQMIQDTGLLIRTSLYTHSSSDPAIPLPQWITAIGDSDPSIFFTDRTGNLYRDCLSLSVDELPVLHGRTPLQVYSSLLQSFRDNFHPFLGSTITDILVGLGPDGELKYPSMAGQRNRKPSGAGEFQCYDKNMLAHLKRHAEASGNPCWGLAGPHDAPGYSQAPDSAAFFRDVGGSWETPYGDFFLSWYANHLVSHGDQVLSMAGGLLADLPVQVHGKVPVLHPWSRTRARPAELAGGYYSAGGRDGYAAMAEVFARNGCGVVLPGMNLCDGLQPEAMKASPEALLGEMMRAFNRRGVGVWGENQSARGKREGLEKIKETLGKGAVGKFTYQRMGAYFFSPEHFPAFTQFVRSLDWTELPAEDLPVEGDAGIPLSVSASDTTNAREMQTA